MFLMRFTERAYTNYTEEAVRNSRQGLPDAVASSRAMGIISFRLHSTKTSHVRYRPGIRSRGN